MKNLSIRQKMIPIYGVISIFTFLLFFMALFMMRAVHAAGAEEGAKIINTFLWIFPGFLVIYFVCIFLIGRTIAKQVAYPAKALRDAAGKIAAGEVDIQLPHQAKDEMGQLSESFREMLVSLREQAGVLQQIAQGDFTASLSLRGDNDAVNRAIMEMLDNNNRMISEIRGAANQVAMGSAQIANSAQSLATGSTEQAATVQQLSAAVSHVQVQAQQNTELADSTVAEVNEAGRLMGESLEYMKQLNGAMATIETSSQEIAKVIKVIDDIAFQTNILALNAAVEAARAGQHGKGFAVVADEVRNLASKSAAAAQQTAALIQSSVENVGKGTGIAAKTGESLNQVGAIAASNAKAMACLSESSGQQSAAITEITAGISQISQVIQSNSATSEENAAAAQEMTAQAAVLNQTIARFRLRGEAPGRAALPQVGGGYAGL